jgi:hypothetical protein
MWHNSVSYEVSYPRMFYRINSECGCVLDILDVLFLVKKNKGEYTTTVFFYFANTMLHRSGCLVLGDLLVVGALVLFPRLGWQGTLLATLFFASSFSWLDLGNDLHCSGHRGLWPLIPVLRQVRAGCTGFDGEDHCSPTPRWCGVPSGGMGGIQVSN